MWVISYDQKQPASFDAFWGAGWAAYQYEWADPAAAEFNPHTLAEVNVEQRPAWIDASLGTFWADEDVNRVESAAAESKPCILAEVIEAVPQTPTCYVHREEQSARFVVVLLLVLSGVRIWWSWR